MEINLPYILRVAIALAIFYILYFTLFRKGKNFLFNRIYFIGVVLMSITIPMLKFQVEVFVQKGPITLLSSYFQSSVSDARFADSPVQQSESVFEAVWLYISQLDWSEILWVFFGLGAGALLLRMVIGHFKIRKIVRNASPRILYGTSVLVTSEKLPPFTYFRKVVIPANILENPYLQAAILHERIHAKGWHCLDLYLADILYILQWFNPFAWLLKRGVRYNIEFLTDDLVTQQMNRDEYQMGMVSLAGKDMIFAFPAASNMSQLKKRIEVMKDVKSIRYQWVRVLLIVPVIALLSVMLSGREIRVVEIEGGVPAENMHIENGSIVEIGNMSRDVIYETTPAKVATEPETVASTTSDDFEIISSLPSIEKALAVVESVVSKQNFVGKMAKNTKKERPPMVFTESNPPKVYYVFEGEIYAPGTLDLNTIERSIKSIEFLEIGVAMAEYGVAPVYLIEKGDDLTEPIKFIYNTPTVSNRNGEDIKTGFYAQVQDRVYNSETIKRVTVEGGEISVESRDNPDDIIELALSYDGDRPAFGSSSKITVIVADIDKVFYMVDDKRVASINNLEANIVELAMLKKEKALELYGESGEDGVVVVKTKKI